MSQYCFDIENHNKIDLDINKIKDIIRKKYIGKDKFNKEEELPFLVIFAKTFSNENDSVCILMKSRAKKNKEKIEEINNSIKDFDLGGIIIKKPYLFTIKQDEWWNRVNKNTSWQSLIHNGPYFTHLMEPYEKLDAKLIYNNKSYDLSPIEEKVARFYVNRIISEEKGNVSPLWTKDAKFNKNFMDSFKKFLRKDYRKIFTDIKKIDWSDIKNKILIKKNKKLTKIEKDIKKVFTIEKKRNYGYAILDGNKEEIQNFTVEPMGIFYGRGTHPSRGIIKKEIMPEDVTINAGIKDPKSKPPIGHNWKKIVHEINATWIAKWENGEGDIKYIRFKSSGKFKGISNLKKYEKARKLNNDIEKVRSYYTKHIITGNETEKQLGTVLYLIDNFGIRVGNEKGEDKADTVGASTLKVGNINTNIKNKIIFDFLGKDSIRFYKELDVTENVYNNIREFIKGKRKDVELFDKINASSINEYLKNFDKDYTAKVFRTRLASDIMNKELKKLNIDKNTTKQKIKSVFNKANVIVADLLNHTRNISENAKESIKKDKEKLKLEKEKLKIEKKKLQKDKESKKIKNSINRIKKKIDSLKTKIETKSDLKNVAITTSLNNYIDPRIVVQWCLSQDIDSSYIYSKQQLADFNWAIQITNKDWDYIKSDIISFDDENKKSVTKPKNITKPKPINKPKNITKPKPINKPISNLDIYIEKYSDKAFVVRGNTKLYKEQLKKIGGRWNKNLKNGEGWIFSLKNLQKVNKLLKEKEIISDDEDEDEDEEKEIIKEKIKYYKLFLELCVSVKNNNVDKDLMIKLFHLKNKNFWESMKISVSNMIDKNINIQINKKLLKIINFILQKLKNTNL